MGGAIIGGRSVPNGALAGGICSTSTTLFNAAMRAGLEIGQRVNHSYYIERYPMGLDATVFKTDSYETDMTFRNDMATPVVIRSYTGNGFVRFDIWGVPDGRSVSLSAPTTSNHGTAIETTVVNSSLAPGSAVRVEYPHNGFDVRRDPMGAGRQRQPPPREHLVQPLPDCQRHHRGRPEAELGQPGDPRLPR